MIYTPGSPQETSARAPVMSLDTDHRAAAAAATLLLSQPVAEYAAFDSKPVCMPCQLHGRTYDIIRCETVHAGHADKQRVGG